MTPKQLAKVILDAQDIREASYKQWGFKNEYELDHKQAAQKSIDLNNLPNKFLEIVYLLNSLALDDIQNWAKYILKGD